MDNAKHRHHFVPRKYLRQWCVGNDDMLAASIKGKLLFPVSIETVGFENQFYSYEQLTLNDIKSVLKFHPCVAPDDFMRAFFHHTIVLPIMFRLAMDPSNNELLEMWRFLGESNLLRGDEQGKLNSLYCEYNTDRAKFLIEKNRIEIEGFENALARIEDSMWPILTRLLKGHCGFIKNEKLAYRFFLYIVMQRTRSPAFMEIAESDNRLLNMSEHILKSARYRRYIYPFDRAMQLARCRSSFAVRLFKNMSSLEYVTGDLPVVEVSRQEKAADYFFPISPRMALAFGLRKGFEKRFKWLDPSRREVVDRLNREICRQSVRQIYATAPNVLAENNYVAKGELPKIDQQQLIRLKEESENDKVTLTSRSVAHDVERRLEDHKDERTK